MGKAVSERNRERHRFRAPSRPRRRPPRQAEEAAATDRLRLRHRAAAKWARARLEEGRGRIGVVVPQLAQRRKEVVRVFSRVMRPGHHLPGAEKTPLPFNVSLGEPLSNYPLVDAALG